MLQYSWDMTVWFMVVLMTIGQQAIAEVSPLQPLPQDLQRYLDICKQTGDLTQNTGQLVFWTSLQQYVSKFALSEKMAPDDAELLSKTVYEIMQPIMGNKTRYKRQAPLRLRKEIRSMTLTERRSYFNAVNAAKNDRRLRPNVYDVMARFHIGRNIERGHFGPAFPSWHRIYLYIYESVLRNWYDPSVTVPYWASVLDDAMVDSTQSVIWSDGFFGNGNGIVNRGPFSTWPQLTPGRVIRRNVGAAGGLFSYARVRNILRNSRNADILFPTATAGNNLEEHHGGPHIYVGGTMSGLQTAAFDPIFFSHHAYIDYIWQQFRDQQFVNPETDYPYDPSDPRFSRLHAPDANAGFSSVGDTTFFGMQLSALTQRTGYLNIFSQIIRYEPLPGCPCDRPYLFCERGVCVARTTTEMAGTFYVQDLGLSSFNSQQNNSLTGSIISKPPPPPPVHQNEGCPRNTYIHDVKTNYMGQNSFSTVNQWAYIPIKVVSKRPPGMTRYETYSLYDDYRPWHANNELTSMCLQKGYSGCKKDDDAVGKINIVSYGLNFDGYAEDYIIVDNRLGVSEGNGYLPVKKPTRSTETEVIIAAFDSCGRVCKPYCNLPYCEGLNKNFNGALSISSSLPERYYDTYEEAILGVWKSSRSYGPKYEDNIVPITFFCEYGDTWIWDQYVPPPWNPPVVSIKPTPPPYQEPVHTYNTNQNHVNDLPTYPQRNQGGQSLAKPNYPEQYRSPTPDSSNRGDQSLAKHNYPEQYRAPTPDSSNRGDQSLAKPNYQKQYRAPTADFSNRGDQSLAKPNYPEQYRAPTPDSSNRGDQSLAKPNYPKQYRAPTADFSNRGDQSLAKPNYPEQYRAPTPDSSNRGDQSLAKPNYPKQYRAPTADFSNRGDQSLAKPNYPEQYRAPTPDSSTSNSAYQTGGNQNRPLNPADCCQVSPNCLIYVPCEGCTNFDSQKCEGSSKTAICLRGRWSVTYRKQIYSKK